MTILSVVQDVALVVGVEQPEQLFGDQERTAAEFRALARAAAERIIEDRDWLALSRSMQLVGSGNATVFPLPADFDRFRMGAEFYSSTTGRAISRLSSPQQAVYAGAAPIAPGYARWRLQGRNVVIEPAPSETLSGVYQSGWYAMGEDGAEKATFEVDGDGFALPERLLRLCMIWMWKANKGLPYGQDFDNFENAAGEAFGREGDRTALAIGPVRTLHGVIQPFYGTITPLPVLPTQPDPVAPSDGQPFDFVSLYQQAKQ